MWFSYLLLKFMNLMNVHLSLFYMQAYLQLNDCMYLISIECCNLFTKSLGNILGCIKLQKCTADNNYCVNVVCQSGIKKYFVSLFYTCDCLCTFFCIVIVKCQCNCNGKNVLKTVFLTAVLYFMPIFMNQLTFSQFSF